MVVDAGHRRRARRTGGAQCKPPRATVTLANGVKVEGEIERLDDFSVAIRLDNGAPVMAHRQRDATRCRDRPVAVPSGIAQGCKDSDIHNVTAYLVTLK